MKEPDQEIGFLEDVRIFDDAEDVKTVRFVSGQGTADVKVTDESMQLFLDTAEQVFLDIHADMAELRAIFQNWEQPQGENE